LPGPRARAGANAAQTHPHGKCRRRPLGREALRLGAGRPRCALVDAGALHLAMAECGELRV